MENKYEFDTGGMWEDKGFFICTNYKVSAFGGGEMCKHCHSKETKIRKRLDGGTYEEIVWICPKVVVAENEGGYNSTGVCLDCIIEANQTIK